MYIYSDGEATNIRVICKFSKTLVNSCKLLTFKNMLFASSQKLCLIHSRSGGNSCKLFTLNKMNESSVLYSELQQTSMLFASSQKPCLNHPRSEGNSCKLLTLNKMNESSVLYSNGAVINLKVICTFKNMNAATNLNAISKF